LDGEAVFAGGDHGGLQFEDAFIGETGGIAEVACSATCGCGEAGVWIENQANMKRMSHG
jgi:hypothetical protein